MVATVVFSLILVILLGIVSHTSALTRQAGERITTFQVARTAFDLLAEKISQATLNTYWDYDNPNRPERYLRSSELHFVVGKAGEEGLPGTQGTGQAVFFQVPLGISAESDIGGLTDLLNACGFYILYGATDALPPPFPEAVPRYRYQLMQVLEVSEDLSVYDSGDTRDWIPGLARHAIPIAENVIYFSVWPRRSPGEDPAGNALSTDFSYDSRLNARQSPQPITANQMPPLLQLTMIVIDETSAQRFCLHDVPPVEIADSFADMLQNSTDAEFSENLDTVESELAALGLNFRVFSALIPIRESKIE